MEFLSERNLLFAGGVIGGTGTGERGGLGGERGGRRLKFEGRMMNRKEIAVPDVCRAKLNLESEEEYVEHRNRNTPKHIIGTQRVTTPVR